MLLLFHKGNADLRPALSLLFHSSEVLSSNLHGFLLISIDFGVKSLGEHEIVDQTQEHWDECICLDGVRLGLEQLVKIGDVKTGLSTKHVESGEDVIERHALCADLLEKVVELAAFLTRCFVLDDLDEGEQNS